MSPFIRAGYNETVIISCYATGLQPITYHWLRRQKSTNACKVKIYDNVLVVKLEAAEDYGKYICHASNLENESALFSVDLKPLSTCAHNHSSISGNKFYFVEILAVRFVDYSRRAKI